MNAKPAPESMRLATITAKSVVRNDNACVESTSTIPASNRRRRDSRGSTPVSTSMTPPMVICSMVTIKAACCKSKRPVSTSPPVIHGPTPPLNNPSVTPTATVQVSRSGSRHRDLRKSPTMRARARPGVFEAL